jgi:para-nitrobenzyl esterase
MESAFQLLDITGEIVYVFNAFPLQDWAWRPVDLKLGDVVSSLWTNFVKTRNPNGMGMPAWPACDPKSEVLLKTADALKAQPAPFQTQLDFLEE